MNAPMTIQPVETTTKPRQHSWMLPLAIVAAAAIWGGVTLMSDRYEVQPMERFSDGNAMWLTDRVTGKTSYCFVGPKQKSCQDLDDWRVVREAPATE